MAMNPLTMLYEALAALALACLTAFCGYFYGIHVQKEVDDSVSKSATITLMTQKEGTENAQRKDNASHGAAYAASAVAISASAAVIDTRMRYRTCAGGSVPQTAASRPAIDGTGRPQFRLDDGSIDLSATAAAIVRLGAENGRLAVKVNELQRTILSEPGYTADN
jgi:hypothetical protein